MKPTGQRLPFDDHPLVEACAGPDEGDEVGTVHGPPPVLGGIEQLEGQVFGGVIMNQAAPDVAIGPTAQSMIDAAYRVLGYQRERYDTWVRPLPVVRREP